MTSRLVLIDIYLIEPFAQRLFNSDCVFRLALVCTMILNQISIHIYLQNLYGDLWKNWNDDCSVETRFFCPIFFFIIETQTRPRSEFDFFISNIIWVGIFPWLYPVSSLNHKFKLVIGYFFHFKFHFFLMFFEFLDYDFMNGTAWSWKVGRGKI